MKTAQDVLKAIKDNDVKYVDLRFTDPRGKWQHVTFDISMIDEEIFAEGTMFDGSSIAGWKAINESDMMLMLDPATATIDPFFAETTMVITCDIMEPSTGQPYNRDPRGIAKKAEATSWWCFSTLTPMRAIAPSISERMSCTESCGGTGK